MLFRITQEEIAAGKRNDPCWCPAACAIRRELPGRLVYVGVDVVGLRLLSDLVFGDYREFDMPRGLKSFIDAFDAGKPVEPMEFELPVDEAVGL